MARKDFGVKPTKQGSDWYAGWEIDSSGASNNGKSGGKIQPHVYGKIEIFEADLAAGGTVHLDELKIVMDSTDDVYAIRDGDYLRWYLDSPSGMVLLYSDNTLSDTGLPDEFFKKMSGSKLEVKEQGDTNFVDADEVRIQVDKDDLNPPPDP